jgi:WD40 repeat protein
MRPGSHAIDNLAAALQIAKVSEHAIDPELLRGSSLALIELTRTASHTCRLQADENVLILVDQFEELFRYAHRDDSMAEQDEKAAFVKLLLEVTKQSEFPVYVVITMRSDFLGDCARFRDLPEAINAGQYLIPRLTREQRRAAIEGPIRMAGGAITPRLVQRILNQLGEDPGQLPVMQHALMRTWNHWKSDGRPEQPLDFDDYEAVGTMEKAISSHADEAFQEMRSNLGKRGAVMVQRLFQRLSDLDQLGRETRRPTSVEELADVCEASLEQVGSVVQCFRKEGRSFLSPLSGELIPSTVIDMTHECLLRNWDRLHDWNREEEESRRIYMRIAARAQDALQVPESATTGQTFADYLEGITLERAAEWWNQRQPNKAWANRYSPGFDLAEQYLRESRQHAEQIRFRRLFGRTATIGVASLLVAAGVALLLYKIRSEKEAANALAMAAIAVPQATSFQSKDPRVSALLAAASLRVKPTTFAQSILSASLDALPVPVSSLTDEPVYVAEFSPDGKWLAVGGENGIDLYDENGIKKKSLTHEGGGRAVKKIIFTGSTEVKAAIGSQIVIWGIASEYHVELNCVEEVSDFSVSQDGRTVAAICGTAEGAKAYLWTAPNRIGRILPTDSKDRNSNIVGLSVSADGTRLAYLVKADDDRRIVVLDIGDPLHVPRSIGAPRTIYNSQNRVAPSIVRSTNSALNNIQFDPVNAGALITTDSEGTIRSWHYSQTEAKSHEQKQSQGFGPGSPSGAQAQRFSVTEGSVLFKLSSPATHLSVNDSWVIATDDHGTGEIWDSTRGVEVVNLGLGMRIVSITASQHSRHLAVVSEDPVAHRTFLHLWRLSNYFEPIDDASVRSHGRYLMTWPNASSDDPRIRIVDIGKGQVVADFSNSSSWTYVPLTISHDGKRIAGFSSRGGLMVSDFSSAKVGEQIWHSGSEKIAIYERTFAFSPNLQYLAGVIDGPNGRHFAVWNLRNDASPKTDLPPNVLGLWDFSPDSQSVFVVTDGGVLHRYKVATGKETPFYWDGHFSAAGTSFDGHTGAAVETANCEEHALEAGTVVGSVGSGENSPRSTIKIFDEPRGGTPRKEWVVPSCIHNFWFSENSEYLATINKDLRTIQLWEVASGTEKALLHSSEDVLDVDLTSEPRPGIVVAGQVQYIVQRWHHEDLNTELCSRLIRDLTPEEWKKYAPGEDYSKHTTCANASPHLPNW